MAACRQKLSGRFATAAALINELVEAKHQLQLGRALAGWARYDLIALDEVGYVPLAEVGAEFPFRSSPNSLKSPRCSTALPIAHYIIETGTESYRFRRTIEKRKDQTPESNMTTAPPAGGGKKESKTPV